MRPAPRPRTTTRRDAATRRVRATGASAAGSPRVDPFAPAERFFRPLRVFAFDPGRGSDRGNVMTIQVPFEPLRRGPIGRRVAVIDYDGARDRFYEPVDLDDRAVLLEGGLEPRDSDPMFHQQMAYAVVSHTLRTFDRALGRQVRFRFQRSGGAAPRERSRLRVYPHAFEEANAYYARDLGALLFGYFPAATEDAGWNIPGQPVFTCLSHDILVHETTHAVVDGMREYLLEPTNPDTLAFHEAFADVIALLQHFTFAEPLVDVIQRTGGRMYRAQLQGDLETDVDQRGPPGAGGALADPTTPGERNPLVDLALQFGEALGTRRALRSAIGTPPDPRALASVLEPHARGAILVAAVFEAYFRVYSRRTRDLFRLAGVGPDHRGELHPDLAERLCREATGVAEELLQLCIRALEFCAAADNTFGDFLRALVTVHARLDPDDPDGYRDALVRAFASRGMFPPDVRSMTAAELAWKPPAMTLVAPESLMELLRLPDPSPAEARRAAQALHGWCGAHRGDLGLVEKLPISVRGFHHAVRLLGAELEEHQDIVCSLMQSTELPVSPGSSVLARVRGGTTLVLRNDGRVRYTITKSLNERRRKAQLDYATDHQGSAASLYCRTDGAVDLRALHRGY